LIKFFRIDERLIHGQIAIKWSKHTGVDHILVANDKAAGNAMIQKSLMMAAPQGIKTAIKSMADSISVLNDARSENFKLLVLVDSPQDAVELIKHVSGVPFVNVGNYGRVAPDIPGKPRKAYSANIYCNEVEVESFKELMSMGLRCFYQVTPESSTVDLNNMFR